MNFPLRSTFVAIPLEGGAKDTFQRLQSQLEPFRDALSFQDPVSPHLTLLFWPSVMQIEFDNIVRQSEKIVQNRTPFELMVNGVDTFGSRGRDTVLFFTVHFSPELAELKKSCPWTDGRPFVPHITIARIKHAERFSVQQKSILKLFKDVAFPVTVDRLRLYGEVGGKKQAVLREFLFM